MKNIIKIAVLCTIMASCSDDDNSSTDCQAKKDAINAQYQAQIEYVRNNPGPNGVDERQIELLEEERDKKLAVACN